METFPYSQRRFAALVAQIDINMRSFIFAVLSRSSLYSEKYPSNTHHDVQQDTPTKSRARSSIPQDNPHLLLIVTQLSAASGRRDYSRNQAAAHARLFQRLQARDGGPAWAGDFVFEHAGVRPQQEQLTLRRRHLQLHAFAARDCGVALHG